MGADTADAGRTMTLECRYCQTRFDMSDSDPDPKLMREHINTRCGVKVIEHSRKVGWLQDMLFFRAIDKPSEWKEAVYRLVDLLMEESGS